MIESITTLNENNKIYLSIDYKFLSFVLFCLTYLFIDISIIQAYI